MPLDTVMSLGMHEHQYKTPVCVAEIVLAVKKVIKPMHKFTQSHTDGLSVLSITKVR